MAPVISMLELPQLPQGGMVFVGIERHGMKHGLALLLERELAPLPIHRNRVNTRTSEREEVDFCPVFKRLSSLIRPVFLYETKLPSVGATAGCPRSRRYMI